jgi:hypothetical protein
LASKKHYFIHPETSKLLKAFGMLAEKGEDETFRYIREELLKKDIDL